jgi:hypothetical protein
MYSIIPFKEWDTRLLEFADTLTMVKVADINKFELMAGNTFLSLFGSRIDMSSCYRYKYKSRAHITFDNNVENFNTELIEKSFAKQQHSFLLNFSTLLSDQFEAAFGIEHIFSGKNTEVATKILVNLVGKF